MCVIFRPNSRVDQQDVTAIVSGNASQLADSELTLSGSSCKTEQAASSSGSPLQSATDPLQLERPEVAMQVLNEDGQIIRL